MKLGSMDKMLTELQVATQPRVKAQVRMMPRTSQGINAISARTVKGNFAAGVCAECMGLKLNIGEAERDSSKKRRGSSRKAFADEGVSKKGEDCFLSYFFQFARDTSGQ